jgi:hypothetical protein
MLSGTAVADAAKPPVLPDASLPSRSSSSGLKTGSGLSDADGESDALTLTVSDSDADADAGDGEVVGDGDCEPTAVDDADSLAGVGVGVTLLDGGGGVYWPGVSGSPALMVYLMEGRRRTSACEPSQKSMLLGLVNVTTAGWSVRQLQP